MGEWQPQRNTMLERVARRIMQSVVRRVVGDGKYIIAEDDRGKVTIRANMPELRAAIDRRDRRDIVSFVVVSEHDTHLMCRMILVDGRLGASEIPVGKNWWLRRGALEGETKEFVNGRSFSYSYSSARRRTVTRIDDDAQNEEKMTPAYIGRTSGQTGEVILAARTPCYVERGSEGPNGEVYEILSVGGEKVKWTMLNDAGRQWTTLPSKLAEE